MFLIHSQCIVQGEEQAVVSYAHERMVGKVEGTPENSQAASNVGFLRLVFGQHSTHLSIYKDSPVP